MINASRQIACFMPLNVADPGAACYGFVMADEVTYECPHCGRALEARPQPESQLIPCPGCGGEFVIPAADTPAEEVQADQELGELDSLRMRHIVVVRRAAIRSRTYCIVGAIGCLMAAVKLGLMTFSDVHRTGWHLRQVLYVLLGLAAVYGMVFLLRRAARWSRESRAGVLPEPSNPPDFSTLSDGSQHARNLENM
jgi:uncharacterized membrane protein YuzA (DUF378 family)/DNA-directed RNA polymerase subunit RPC12/RpoP